MLAAGAAVMLWINRSLCKPEVSGLIPDFTSQSDETKLWPTLNMTLAVGGTLKTNTTTNMIAGEYSRERTLLRPDFFIS